MQMPLCAATVCIHYRTTVAYSYFVFVLRSRSTPPLNIWIHPLWCRPVNICSSPSIRTQTASHTHTVDNTKSSLGEKRERKKKPLRKNSREEAKLFRCSLLPPGQLAAQPTYTAQKTHVPNVTSEKCTITTHAHWSVRAPRKQHVYLCCNYQQEKTLESSGSLPPLSLAGDGEQSP